MNDKRFLKFQVEIIKNQMKYQNVPKEKQEKIVLEWIEKNALKLRENYTKGNMEFFKLKEFACPCCAQMTMEPEFLEKIDNARKIANLPFIVSSGFRCAEHNKKVGGGQRSSHLKGWAADIKAETSRNRFFITRALISIGINRIGIGKDFIHADCDPSKDNFVTWLYD